MSDEVQRGKSDGVASGTGPRCEVERRTDAEQQILAYQSQLQVLTLKSVLAEERERRRIAVGLHDDLGQNLATARMLLDGLTQSQLSEEANQRLETIRNLIDQSIRTTRSLTFELSSPILYELGLEPALKTLAEQMTKASDIPFTFDSDGEPKSLAVDVRVVLFRIMRELAHNVVKHAGARAARIAVAAVGDEVRLRIEDDGVGIGGPESRDDVWTEGFGLISIREQLKSIGGRLEIETEAGRGTRVLVVAPLDGHGKT